MKMYLLSCLLWQGMCCLPTQKHSVSAQSSGYSVVSDGTARNFLFPEFQTGYVHFANGTKRAAQLNYNFWHGQVQFIGGSADTLVVTGKGLIDRVEFAGKVFFLSEHEGDMQAVARYGNVYLAEKVQPETVGNKLDHSGQRFSASDDHAPSSLLVSNQGGHFQWENNSTGQSWAFRSSYYLIDGNKLFHPASRRSFLRVFARHRGQVAKYLRTHRVDFRNGNDLEELLAYCVKLTLP